MGVPRSVILWPPGVRRGQAAPQPGLPEEARPDWVERGCEETSPARGAGGCPRPGKACTGTVPCD